jgi:flagellar assembly protein FliH
MGLYKGHKDDTPSKAFVRKSTIVRADADFQSEEIPAAVHDPAARKVFGTTKPTTVNMTRTLPPISESVIIPSGGRHIDPSTYQTQSSPGPQDSPSAGNPAPSVSYSAGPTVDQQIIEEAQQRANQMLHDAQTAANQMLAEYQTQAQQMMEQANEQIQSVAQQLQMQAQEQGFQQGYQQGLESGAQAGQQQVGQLIYQVRDLYVQAIKQRQWLMQSVEPELARLSTKVAEKIVGEELKCNPEVILGIVKSALTGLGDREEISVRVNPVDYQVAHKSKPVFERMVEGLKKFEIISDASIDEGGCVIETNLGNMDARLSTQIATLEAAFDEHARLHEADIKAEIEDQAAVMMAQNPEPQAPEPSEPQEQ